MKHLRESVGSDGKDAARRWWEVWITEYKGIGPHPEKNPHRYRMMVRMWQNHLASDYAETFLEELFSLYYNWSDVLLHTKSELFAYLKPDWIYRHISYKPGFDHVYHALSGPEGIPESAVYAYFFRRFPSDASATMLEALKPEMSNKTTLAVLSYLMRDDSFSYDAIKSIFTFNSYVIYVAYFQDVGTGERHNAEAHAAWKQGLAYLGAQSPEAALEWLMPCLERCLGDWAYVYTRMSKDPSLRDQQLHNDSSFCSALPEPHQGIMRKTLQTFYTLLDVGIFGSSSDTEHVPVSRFEKTAAAWLRAHHNSQDILDVDDVHQVLSSMEHV